MSRGRVVGSSDGTGVIDEVRTGAEGLLTDSFGSIGWPQHPQRTHVGAHWPSSVPGASVMLQGSGTTSAKTPDAFRVRNITVRTNAKRLNQRIVASNPASPSSRRIGSSWLEPEPDKATERGTGQLIIAGAEDVVYVSESLMDRLIVSEQVANDLQRDVSPCP